LVKVNVKMSYNLTNRDIINNNVSICVTGDSLAVGLGASRPENTFAVRLAEKLSAKLFNFSGPGSSTRALIDDHFHEIGPADPDLIVITVGANDILKRTSIRDFRDAWQDAVSRLAVFGCPVVVMNIPHLALTPSVKFPLSALLGVRTRQFNRIIAKAIEPYQSLYLFNFYERTGELLRSKSGFFSADGFHPSDAGQEVMAEEVAEFVRVAHLLGKKERRP
jgi:lysophospholipase L1-like esterase